MIHIRRKFVKSLEENCFVFLWFIDEIGKLFAIEHDCKRAGYDAVQVRAERLQRSKPIIVELGTSVRGQI
ncbi:IS66 family transposase [Bacteroides finegoldii]|uniref:IS66 family transposase n=1 Tax=Bacteroides finegoldii TaxID=338188 RepID=UPI003AF279C9